MVLLIGYCITYFHVIPYRQPPLFYISLLMMIACAHTWWQRSPVPVLSRTQVFGRSCLVGVVAAAAVPWQRARPYSKHETQPYVSSVLIKGQKVSTTMLCRVKRASVASGDPEPFSLCCYCEPQR